MIPLTVVEETERLLASYSNQVSMLREDPLNFHQLV